MHNEQDNVRALYDDIKGVMKALGQSHEIIFVNDASTDQTLATMREIQASDADFHFADLETNVGENWALLAGISKAQGEVIITIDGDYQNDPAYIPDLLRGAIRKVIELYPGGENSEPPLSGPNVSLHKSPTR